MAYCGHYGHTIPLIAAIVECCRLSVQSERVIEVSGPCDSFLVTGVLLASAGSDVTQKPQLQLCTPKEAVQQLGIRCHDLQYSCVIDIPLGAIPKPSQAGMHNPVVMGTCDAMPCHAMLLIAMLKRSSSEVLNTSIYCNTVLFKCSGTFVTHHWSTGQYFSTVWCRFRNKKNSKALSSLSASLCCESIRAEELLV
jgi:hypothetical protein